MPFDMNTPSIEFLLALSAVILALTTVWTKGVRPVVRILILAEKAVPLIEELVKQFRPNGGSSLGDTIRSIEESITTTAAAVAKNTERIEEMEKRVFERRRTPTVIVKEVPTTGEPRA